MATDKKKPQNLGPTWFSSMRAAFCLIPNRHRTWAPKGQTPVHDHLFTQGKISTIGALTVSPKRTHLALYRHCHTQNLTGLEVKAFLPYLLRHLRGPILLLWDRATIHKRQEIAAYLHHHPRVPMEYFPAYYYFVRVTKLLIFNGEISGADNLRQSHSVKSLEKQHLLN